MAQESGGGDGGGPFGRPQGAATEGSPSSWNGVLTDPNLVNAVIDFFSALILSLESLFQGRPQAQATQQSGSRLLRSPNVAAKLYAMMLLRGLKELDVDISQSGPRAEIEDAFFGNFVKNLENQGISAERAKEIGVHALSREAQAGAPLEPELRVEMPNNFQLYGHPKFAQVLQLDIAHAQERGLIGDSALTEAAKQLYLHGPLSFWVNSQFSPTAPPGLVVMPLQAGSLNPPSQPLVIPTQQIPGENPPPPPLTINPITGQPLPDGYGWDRTTQQPLPMDFQGALTPPPGYQFNPCINATEPIPPTWSPGSPLGSPPPIPATQSPAQPFDLCCQQIIINLQYLAAAVATAGAASTGVGLLPALESLNLTLTEIRDRITTAPAAPAEPTPALDLQPLIEALKEINKTDLGSAPILDEMVKQGTLDAELGQLLGDPVRLRIDPSRIHPKVRKWLNDTGLVPTVGSDDHASDFVRLLRSAFNWVATEGESLITSLESKAPHLASVAEGIFGKVFAGASKLETTIPRDVLDLVLKTVVGTDGITAENVEEKALQLFGSAFLVGQGVHLLAAIAGYLGYPMTSIWGNNAELMVDMLGYKEILRSFHGAFYPIAITERAKQKYNRQFRPRVLTQGETLQAFARRKLGEPATDLLLALNGLDGDHAPAAKEIGYRPISPRILQRGFRNRAPDPALLKRIIEDQGIEPDFVELFEQIIIDASYETLETELSAKAIATAGIGAMTLNELDSTLTAAHWDDKARALAKQLALLERQQNVAKETERAALEEVAGGTITADQARSLMAAAGIDTWRIDTTVTLAQTKAALAEAKKVEAEERRLARETFATEQKTLAAQFLDGDLNLAAYTAAMEAALLVYVGGLAGLGATPAEVSAETDFGEAQIAAQIAFTQATAQGRAVFDYGQTLSRAAAQVLRARVDEIKTAVTRENLDAAQAARSLRDLQVPEKLIQALVGRWVEQAAKKASFPLGVDQPRY